MLSFFIKKHNKRHYITGDKIRLNITELFRSTLNRYYRHLFNIR